ncbi:MAG TPA: type II toxin-antitoxin system VapC family toxin [Stellaceae bacterium]|nr:type II toxin-antitoxin system VapC family toxin [Stellaceae bacterium]
MGSIDHYLDASFLVALLTAEPASSRATSFVSTHSAGLIVSDFAAAEFASAISRHVRMGHLPRSEGQSVLSAFDRWALTAVGNAETSPSDIALAASFLRHLDLVLRTPDAIHIAVAQRLAATLITFDRRMADASRALRIPVIEP